MQTKHTPGPWRAETWDYSLRNPPENIPVVVSHDLMICECNSNKGHYNPFTHTLETAQANAALIAAAPDLLKHCQTMLSWWEKNPDVLKRFPTLAIDEIRAAIRKAEGGAA